MNIKRIHEQDFWMLPITYVKYPNIPEPKFLYYLATEDKKITGVICLDSVDFDFSWMVHAEMPSGEYLAIDFSTSWPTFKEAEGKLRESMEEMYKSGASTPSIAKQLNESRMMAQAELMARNTQFTPQEMMDRWFDYALTGGSKK